VVNTPAAIDDVPGVVRMHHVAIVVNDIDAALAQIAPLGGLVELRAIVAEQGVEAATIEWGNGGTLLEFIAPLSDDSGVARFLAKRGSGVHHVARAVRDVASAIDSIRAGGGRLIDEVPRPGLHGTPVAFVHPSVFGGVLVELVEVPAS
jgi:methylmalonyl-CoA/ethylmalonyl-CoA epimerase